MLLGLLHAYVYIDAMKFCKYEREIVQIDLTSKLQLLFANHITIIRTDHLAALGFMKMVIMNKWMIDELNE